MYNTPISPFNLFVIVVLSLSFYSCKQVKPTIEPPVETPSTASNPMPKVGNFNVPKIITRNIIQDRDGDIWIAAFDGAFRYDGTSFVKMSNFSTLARYFSVLEDRNGAIWFGTIGNGIYRQEGTDVQNFTTKDGLLNNEVGSIYEDKKGNIWFGVSGGISCYDGKSFKNYIIVGETLKEDVSGIVFEDREPQEVNSILQDSKGSFWFATRGNTFVYDGKTFKILTYNDKVFKNIRTVIEDSKGNIWFSGNDGLWKYKDGQFTNYEQRFVGYIMEDSKGNIWTSAEKEPLSGWLLSKYDGNTLSNAKPTVSHIAEKPMIFGILEAKDGSIWFGHVGGVSRYDGKAVVDFNSNAN